ncbi:MAG: IclR family transcriptional regulator [Alphaproteobacteria bacterium]|nr:MAG: IclR family transcriptional regulator [Alphaproteobacteria bacterium]
MKSSIVQKLLALLTVISESAKPLTFSEITRKSGLNKSTIHRILSICIDEKLVRYDERSRTYFLGPKVYDLVRNAYDGHDIQAMALDEMIRLFDLFEANVTLGVPSGMEVVYLRLLESPHSLGGAQRPGMREPVHCSASGKALLAFLPDKVIESRLKGYEFTRFTERTIDNAEDFRAELAFVRENGFGKNDREEYDHFVGISAPVFNYVGEPIAVLNIWSVYPRHSIDDLMGWSGELKKSARRVTALIGGLAPSKSDLIAGSCAGPHMRA